MCFCGCVSCGCVYLLDQWLGAVAKARPVARAVARTRPVAKARVEQPNKCNLHADDVIMM